MFKNLASKNFIFNFAAFGWLLLLLIMPVHMTREPFFMNKTIFFAGKLELDESLQAQTDALLPLFGNMPPVSVYLTGEPVIITGTNTERGVAYTNCANHESPSIVVKKFFYEKTNQKQLVNILKHELTHAWLCRRNLMSGHDENFRQKFAEVGGFGN